MKSIKTKWIAIALAALLVVGLIPTAAFTAFAADAKQEVYTRFSGKVQEHSGDGTKENPYNLFDDAVKNVANNGKIIILGESGAFLNALDETGSKPYVIDKSVTITAEEGKTATLSIRPSGLILGGNVTFKNIELGFANKIHDSIFANGHTLTLENVTRSSGHRLVDLFGGTLYNTDGTTLADATAKAGTNGKIIIKGTGEFGNIYAGSMNGKHSGDVSIEIDAASTAKLLGHIYASGAKEAEVPEGSWFDIKEPEAPAASATQYPVTGTVSITMNKILARNIDGAGATTTNVTLSTEFPVSNLSLTNISSLNITKGTIQPTTLSAKTDGTMDLTVPANATLDLSSITASSLKVKDFTGGGTLVLGKLDSLTITGTTSGTTKFETANGYNGHSGIAQSEHEYIKTTATADNNATFTFTPFPGQTGLTLTKNDNGIWKTSTLNEDPIYVTELSIPQSEYTTQYTAINGINSTELAVTEVGVKWTPETQGSTENNFFESLALTYQIEYQNVTYPATMVYSDDEGLTTATFPELNLEISAQSPQEDNAEGTDTNGILSVNKYMPNTTARNATGMVETGDYKITITAPTKDGTDKTASTTLKVVDPDAITYTVNYYQQNTEGTGYTKVDGETETKTGKAGESAQTTNKTYTGFSTTPKVKYKEDGGTESETEVKLAANKTLEVNVYYDRNTYTVTYQTNNKPEGAPEAPAKKENIRYGQKVTLEQKQTFAGWTQSAWYSTDVTLGTNDTEFQMPNKNVTITADWTQDAIPTAEYTVHYHQQNVDDDNYTEVTADKITKTGNVGSAPTFEQKTYEGFATTAAKTTYKVGTTEHDTVQNIPADNTTLEVHLYYNRNTYTVTYTTTGGPTNKPADPTAVTKVRFGKTVTLPAKGTVDGWTQGDWTTADATITNNTFTMPAKDVTVTATWTQNPLPQGNYTVRYYQQNANGQGYTEVTAEAENKTGDVGSAPVLTPKSYLGFGATPTRVTYKDNTTTESTTVINIKENETVEVSVYYDRTVFGGFQITNNIEGDAVLVTVTLSDTSFNGAYGDVTFANGVATFSMQNAQMITGANLPLGIGYTVSVTDQAGNPVVINGQQVAPITGTIGDNTFDQVVLGVSQILPPVNPEPINPTPAEPAQGNMNNIQAENLSNVQTGDYTIITISIAGSVLALAAIVIVISVSKKRNRA